MKYLLILMMLALGPAESTASGFKNHRGESFEFSISTRLIQKPSSTVLISHGSSCLVQQQYDWANQVNKWGYNAVIIDHCSVRGIAPYTGSSVIAYTTLRPEKKVQDYVNTAEWVKVQNWHSGKIFVIGFSRGDSGVINLIDRDWHDKSGAIAQDKLKLIDAAVAFYPACSPYEPPLQPSIPALFHHGKEDALSGHSKCRYSRLKDPKYQISLYDKAGHSFDDFGPQLIIKGYVAREYNREADVASRKITKQFLDDNSK
jgi:dienelactone hydrolase